MNILSNINISKFTNKNLFLNKKSIVISIAGAATLCIKIF